jgi:hypothetical protein
MHMSLRFRQVGAAIVQTPPARTWLNKLLIIGVTAWLIPVLGFAQAQQAQRSAGPEPWMSLPPSSTGLTVGRKIPPFQLQDQSGRPQTFESVRGPNGLAIYFIRSADW